MEEKTTNKSTSQRPEGNRVINATEVIMNLNHFIKQIKGEEIWAKSDKNSITVFKSDTMRVLLIGLHKDGMLKPHTANGDITVQTLSGRMIFKTPKGETELCTGQMIALHSNIEHSVVALEESFFLVTLAFNKK